MSKILMQDEVYLRAIDSKQEKGGEKKNNFLPSGSRTDISYYLGNTILARSAFPFNSNDNAIILYLSLDWWIALLCLPDLRLESRRDPTDVLFCQCDGLTRIEFSGACSVCDWTPETILAKSTRSWSCLLHLTGSHFSVSGQGVPSLYSQMRRAGKERPASQGPAVQQTPSCKEMV